MSENIKIDEFLQSNSWRKFQESLGRKTFDVGQGYGVITPMPFGLKSFYVPRLDLNSNELEKVIQLAKDNNCLFVRYEPIYDLKYKGFIKTKDHQPSNVLIADLSLDEERLESELHTKTRYNIKLAQKKGVEVDFGKEEYLNDFLKLISQTYSRKNISTHSLDYYSQIVKNIPEAFIAVAKVDGNVIVANLCIKHGNTVTYLHGGSDNEHRAYMAPHLLQWAQILQAKRDGFKYYDFGGIAPDDDKKHPWAGITRFKYGFTQNKIGYPGTFEYPISPLYCLYKIYTKLR